jgi:hypothetical protein
MQRSLEYYRSDAGKIKKKNLNARRRHHMADFTSTENRLGGKDDHVAADMVRHLQVVTGLIEARRVARQEIKELVAEILRQLRIDNGKKMAYPGCEADNRSP